MAFALFTVKRTNEGGRRINSYWTKAWEGLEFILERNGGKIASPIVLLTLSTSRTSGLACSNYRNFSKSME